METNPHAEKNSGGAPGMTFRALAASILCMLLAGLYVQYCIIILSEPYLIPESAIPIPAMAAVLALTLFTGLFAAVFKMRLLTRPELVCVAFATLLSVPLMTQGFWHRFLAIISAPPRNESFDYIDAYGDDLWPHGPNLLAGAFDDCPRGADARITWAPIEYEEGATATLPTLTNNSATNETFLSFTLAPAHLGGKAKPLEPHLASVLAKTDGTETESEIFCRVLADGSATPTVLFTARKCDKPTFLHKKGFVRIGAYGVIPAKSCPGNLVVQLGLKGRGRVTFADPKLMSVGALESAFRGRKTIGEDAYLALPPGERPEGAAIKPAHKWSLANIAFYAKGYIPVGDWLRPAAIWGSYILLLLTALFCVNAMMRRKWAESERYPMPNARIPMALVGAGDGEASPWASVWKNRYAQAGFVLALAYGVLKGWHAYNPELPDLDSTVNLGEYITNPVFGNMFNVQFVFSLFICSIAVFFELNMLMSIVVGYWACRSMYFFGHAAAIDVNAGFPWFREQTAGAYIGYFAVVAALSSKYIWGVLKDAARGEGGHSGEVLSPRAAVVLFVLCHVGAAAWAVATGTPAAAMTLMFCFLVMVGFVAAKFRAECGSPFGYFTPYNAMLFVGAVGGLSVFGAKGMFVSLLLSGFTTVTVFYLIPGIQFEAIEVGRRLKIAPRHIIRTCLVGVLGGLFIGGWIFLSNAYSYGGDNLKYQWGFNGLNWYVNGFREPLAQATNAWLSATGGADAAVSFDWGGHAMVFGGAAMVVLTLLRQFFAGFWFHPMGFLLGFTYMNDGANWGTLLIAWAIRYAVLKIGGARAVRNKMQPFFTGVFAGCVAAIVAFTIVNGVAAHHGSTLFYYGFP